MTEYTIEELEVVKVDIPRPIIDQIQKVVDMEVSEYDSTQDFIIRALIDDIQSVLEWYGGATEVVKKIMSRLYGELAPYGVSE